MSNAVTTVALMGATGSIGQQTLDVLRRERDHFQLVAISGGGSRLEDLAASAREFLCDVVVVRSDEQALTLRGMLPTSSTVLVGDEGLTQASALADTVVNAVMGFAGLPITLSALSHGKRLALANKESLIAAAPLVERVRDVPGAELLPIDSEHCAIHQALAGSRERSDVRRLILTASGGPFRTLSRDELDNVTVEKALAHPTWSMGPKISVDSSTLMNKGLEVLEASALFGFGVDLIDVVVHPQSIVHSMVEYVDGSVLAQLSMPDMRLPIAYCLGYPGRFNHEWGAMDFTQAMRLDFEAPDTDRFPALNLAYEAGRTGGAAPAWLSAANEVAVDAFLQGGLHWRAIPTTVAKTLESYQSVDLENVDALLAQDRLAREVARRVVAGGE